MPEGIGYASLAGLNPMLGIYSGMVPVAIAATATGSVLLMSTLTSAIALTMGGILDSTGYTGDQVNQAVFTMSLLAGVMMVVLGVLKLGKIVNYVSNAVMTGFVMGVAILIMVGKFDDIFGYDPTTYSNKVIKAIDIVLHPGDWDYTTTVVGIGTIVAAFALKAIPKLERYALVLVVLLGTAIVWILDINTLLISDEATIPTGLAALPIPIAVDAARPRRWCRPCCSARPPSLSSHSPRAPASDRRSPTPMVHAPVPRATSWARVWATSRVRSSSPHPRADRCRGPRSARMVARPAGWRGTSPLRPWSSSWSSSGRSWAPSRRPSSAACCSSSAWSWSWAGCPTRASPGAPG